MSAVGPAGLVTAQRSLPQRLRAAVARRLAPPTIVLLYHRVLPEVGRDPNLLAVSSANFAAQLTWLNRHCRRLDVPGFLRNFERPARTRVALDGGKPRVLVTFDDGYADNFHYALPILQHHGWHGLVFACSGLIGTNEPYWWDALERIVFDGVGGGRWCLPDGTTLVRQTDPRASYAELHGQLKPLGHDQRRAVLDALAEQSQVGREARDLGRPMTWNELRGWCAGGMFVGGHTCTHPQLAALPGDEVEQQITADRETLEHELGCEVETFAYPYGTLADFDERAARAAAAAGYRCAFANHEGNARWSPGSYAILRCLVRDWPVTEFAARFAAWCR